MPTDPTPNFEALLTRWNLVPDGQAIHTHSSDLLPVLWQGQKAMLKVARSDEEETGNRLMVWLAGDGAARVYAHDGPALLMERLNSEPSLADMVHAEQDDQATRILCAAATKIHHPRQQPAPELPTLKRWFRSLEQAAPQGGMLQTTWKVAQQLLNHPQDERPLHGDIHHGNVMHSGRGWLAIDPKGILGERGYDYANIFCNPDMNWARQPGRLARQSHLIAELAGLERARLLHWVAAYAGLSAAWWLENNEQQHAHDALQMAALALAELRN